MNPGKFINPRDGSKKTSREEEAKSSKIETKSGGSKELPLAIYMALMAYLKKIINFQPQLSAILEFKREAHYRLTRNNVVHI